MCWLTPCNRNLSKLSTFKEKTKNCCHKLAKSAILLLEIFDFKNIFVGHCNTWDAYQKKRFFILIQKIWCFSLRRSEEIAFEVKMPFSNSGNSVAIFVPREGDSWHFFWQNENMWHHVFAKIWKIFRSIVPQPPKYFWKIMKLFLQSLKNLIIWVGWPPQRFGNMDFATSKMLLPLVTPDF